jgi:AAA family ATP:ADP antiporter
MLASAQGIRRAIDFAIVRPAREVLFTVVSRAAKYKAKSVIETVVYRGGDAVSGWIFAGLAGIGIGFFGVAAVFAPVAAVWTGLAVRLGILQDRRAKQGAAPPDASVPFHGSASLGHGASDKRGFE